MRLKSRAKDYFQFCCCCFSSLSILFFIIDYFAHYFVIKIIQLFISMDSKPNKSTIFSQISLIR